MRAAWAGLALLSAVALAACGSSNAHKGEHCARSHQEMVYQPPIYVNVGGGKYGGGIAVPVGGGMHQTTVCDQWVADNPATVVPSTAKGN